MVLGPMGLAIVVLAAGLGTRYGGRKQLEPLGPSGEVVLDYTLHDAGTAGFSRAVVVVAPGMVDAMAAHFNEFVPPIAVHLVVQTADTARTTPWGTAHAAIVGAAGSTAPFAVANADDLYGAEAVATMAAHLRTLEDRPRTYSGACVGFAARATLSAHGGVSRAVCRVGAHRRLLGIEEHTGVRLEASGLVSDAGRLDDTTLVSMNLWGFEPSVVDVLRPVVERFTSGADAIVGTRELRLPDVVGELVERGELEVTVLPTTSAWLGVTYPQDAANVRERLAALTTAGVYPSRVIDWGGRHD
jgi:dTDP-glucose pyrophosphorylase